MASGTQLHLSTSAEGSIHSDTKTPAHKGTHNICNTKFTAVRGIQPL